MSSVIVASEPLKLSGILHDNCDDDAAVDHGNVVVDIRIVDVLCEKSFHFVIHIPPLCHLKQEKRN